MPIQNMAPKVAENDNFIVSEIDSTGIYGVLFEKNPPIIRTTELKKAHVGIPYSDTVFVVDLDIDQTSTLKYKIEKGPKWLSFEDNNKGILKGTPSFENNNSQDQVIINVADSTGLSDSLNTFIYYEVPPHVADYPKNFVLYPSFPNPFNSSTTISYEIPDKYTVILCIYDILGNRIKVLQNGIQNAGFYKIMWDGKDNRNNFVSSGIYLIEMKSEKYTSCKKVLLLR